jgi:hypothetical protein
MVIGETEAWRETMNCKILLFASLIFLVSCNAPYDNMVYDAVEENGNNLIIINNNLNKTNENILKLDENIKVINENLKIINENCKR